MIQIVATIDNSIFDPLKATMQCLKSTMLKTYASEICPEDMDIQYDKHFTYVVVKLYDFNKALDLLHKLNRSECHDLHVYTTNVDDIEFLKMQFGDMYRFCECEWRV